MRSHLRFSVIAAGATVVASFAGLGLPASAATAGSAPAPRAAVHVVNLHAAFERALPRTKSGPRAGIVPARSARTGASAAGHSGSAVSRDAQTRAGAKPASPAACTEPECDLSYGGGAVQHSPHVYLLLWGPNWSESSAAYKYLKAFYSGLGVSPQDTWSTITSQYTDTTGKPTFGKSVFVATYQDTSTPPNPVTENDLAAEADALVTGQNITDIADAQIVVASQSGTCFNDGFVGSCGTVTSGTGYCAWHSITSNNVPFINLPYLLDAGFYCGENWINSGSAGTYDGFSTVGGHEYAETITDPSPFGGWSDPNDTISDGGGPGEIGDKCAWAGQPFGLTLPAGDVTLSTGKFAMQSLWSNAAGRCVMTMAPKLTVQNPGTQKSTLGSAVSLRIHATSNTGTALSFKATGLPPGLSISKAGLISGKPGTTAGTWKPTVTVSNGSKKVQVTFSWQASSKAGQVKGYAAKCADDYIGRTANGTKIDLWSCNGHIRQRITFTASGELKVVGKCVTAHTKAVLEPCTGSSNQVWTRHANGVYVVKSNGRCLTDPGNSKSNGTQLSLAVCKDAPAQRWGLP